MPAFTASASGKIILFGEHAVVYGQPAIAVPVEKVRVRAVVSADPRANPGSMFIEAPGIGLQAWLHDLPREHPLACLVQLLLAESSISRLPACRLHLSSTIPVAAGLGSGAAVSVAVLRALSAFLGHPLENSRVNALAYEVEKLHHGTPSGIDNTVITYAQPVYFIRNQPIQTFQVSHPFTIVIGDTGIASPTSIAVSELRYRWQADPLQYNQLFEAVGALVQQARHLIETGKSHALGSLMDQNHLHLQHMGVSSPELDTLVHAARSAGALGAKLSGGGRGGNMIALVEPVQAQVVERALVAAGAVRAITTRVQSKSNQPTYF